MAQWSAVQATDDQAEGGVYLQLVKGEQLPWRWTLMENETTPQNLSGYHITASAKFRMGQEENGRPIGPFAPLMAGGAAVPDASIQVVAANQNTEPGVVPVEILSTLLPSNVDIAIDAQIIPMAFVALSVNDQASPTPDIQVARFIIS